MIGAAVNLKAACGSVEMTRGHLGVGWPHYKSTANGSPGVSAWLDVNDVGKFQQAETDQGDHQNESELPKSISA